MNDLATGAVIAQEVAAAVGAEGVCRIDMLVDDALVVPELLAFPAGPDRDTYVLTALRIGVLALKQAQGRLDADAIRSEADRLFATLEGLLRSQIGASDSELARTLAAHVGDQSALMKILRPTETGGILHSLSQAMDKALETQRDAILSEALTESEQARKNRQAEVGVFVFSRRTAGSQIAPLARYGNDIVVVWDCEDAASDVVLNAGISLARALCASAGADQQEIDIDLERMQRAMLDVEKQIQGLEDIRKNAQSIRSCADKVEDRARLVSENIERATRILNEEAEGIHAVVRSTGNA